MLFKKSESYSQYYEDVLLRKVFKNKIGTCVEVGANDGITFSNTLLFERLGWICVLIEPDPNLYRKILLNRKHSISINIAASDKKVKSKNFYIPKNQNLYSSLEIKSTMSDSLSANKVSIRQTKVTCDTLDRILFVSGIKTIDFISIDVEGHEMNVLQGFSLAIWNPYIVIIEDATDISLTKDKSKIFCYMKENNYLNFYRSGGNDWYIERKNFNLFFFVKLICYFELKGLIIANFPFFIKSPLIHFIRLIRRQWQKFCF